MQNPIPINGVEITIALHQDKGSPNRVELMKLRGLSLTSDGITCHALNQMVSSALTSAQAQSVGSLKAGYFSQTCTIERGNDSKSVIYELHDNPRITAAIDIKLPNTLSSTQLTEVAQLSQVLSAEASSSSSSIASRAENYYLWKFIRQKPACIIPDGITEMAINYDEPFEGVAQNIQQAMQWLQQLIGQNQSNAEKGHQ